MKKIAIVGAGELGIQFLHYINSYSSDKVVGWFDDTNNKDCLINGVKVLGRIEDIEASTDDFECVLIAIGYKHLPFKYKLINQLKGKVLFYTFIHPTANIDKTAIIEEGCFIYPNVTVDKGCHIKSGVLLNNSVTISHNSVIEECVFIAPGCTLSGFVHVKSKTFLGTGTIVVDDVVIYSSVKTGAGTVVIQNIDQQGLHVGNPARFIR